MIVLDTHAWLWWRARPDLLSGRVRSEIDAADRVGVSVMSGFEVARLADEERITIGDDVRAWIRQALADDRSELLGVTADIAVTAAQLDRRSFPGDPADRLIFASALAAGARLATKDRQIRAFDPASTVW